MSFEASAWAVKADVSRSAMKNLLMILAHITNDETGELYPSLAYLEAHTGLSRKTVIACMSELESEEMGVLERTGEMKGRTQQIPVYRFICSARVPMIVKGTGGKFHRLKPGEERVAFLPAKGGVFAKETGVKTPPGIEKGNREVEDSPPSLREGHPPSDLFGSSEGEIAVVPPSRPSIMEHVAEGWATLCAQHPRIPTVRFWNASRKAAIARRADEVVRGSNGVLDAYQVWDMIFRAIHTDEWLRGDSNPRPGYDRAFVIDIDRVLRPRDFLNILERSTTNERDHHASHDASTGRAIGPAEQATRNALARLRARQQRSGSGEGPGGDQR